MKIFVMTCDKFSQIMKGFAYMFNKHWSPDVEVTVLGYSIPPPDLPNNFKFVSLAKQQRDWTSDLIPFFKQLPDEYFGIMLDDYYILDINKSLISEAEEHMKSGIEKVSFISLKYYSETFVKEKNANFDVMGQNFKHRLAIWPQFVRRDYFLRYLYPGKTIWQYEANFKNFPKGPINDGAQILAPKQDIVPYAMIVKKGKITKSKHISKISKEDLSALEQLGLSFRSGEAV